MAPPHQFEGLPLRVETGRRKFVNVRPHITRTVKWSPHGIHFPLFPNTPETTTQSRELKNAKLTRERKSLGDKEWTMVAPTKLQQKHPS